MASITFDIGCLPNEMQVVEKRRSVGTAGPLGFARTRQVYPRPVRLVRIAIPNPSSGQVSMAYALYSQSRGILPMDFTDDTGTTFEVAFTEPPQEFGQLGPQSWDTLVINLEECL